MKNNILALDSNIFIYYFQEHPSYISYTKTIVNDLSHAKAQGITSVISLIESLSYPLPKQVLTMIEEGFRTLPNLTICDITIEISIEAARIRRDYGFRLPDSIQLATALSQKATIFITNDKRLKKFNELEVVLLEEFDK